MELPFTASAFLDLFGLYNRALWPVVVGAWLVSLAVVIRSCRVTQAGRGALALLAAHWLWSGVVYHWLYYLALLAAGAVLALDTVAPRVLAVRNP